VNFGKCVATQYQIVAQFHVGPKRFVKVRMVLQTRHAFYRHVATTMATIFEEDMCDEIAMESGILKSSIHCVLTHWHTQTPVRRSERSMSFLLILAFCQ